MATNIRSNVLCKGIQLPAIENADTDNNVKIAQLAVDTVIFTRDETCLKYLFSEIDLFCKISGLKLNKTKSKGVWIGSKKNNQSTPLIIAWTKDLVKFLGVYVGYDKHTCKKKLG